MNRTLSFSQALKQEVNKYFSSNNIKIIGGATLYIKTGIILSAWVLVYSMILITHSLWWFPVLGVIVALVGFNIMHDASHGAYTKNKMLSKILRFLGADTMGASGIFWHEKHDIMHHTYTNVIGMDNDISKTPLFRLAPNHVWKPYHRYQHIYCWFLYLFVTLWWFYYDDFITFKNKKIDNHTFTMKLSDKIIFWVGKIVHITLFIVIPISVIGWKAIIGILILHGVTSIILAIVFQLAHVVEGVDFHDNNNGSFSFDDWYVHEVRTTADFARNSKIAEWLLGGLNFQVIHHLFRHISHIHYRNISGIVEKVCNEYNVSYHSFPTFGMALKSHYYHLKKLGREK